jgi:hypothetical protein
LQPHVGKDNGRTANGSVLLSSSIKPVPKEDKEAASAAYAQPSFQGFCDRLAAAQDKRVITSSSPIVDHKSVPETTAVSRAAALRARLNLKEERSKRG